MTTKRFSDFSEESDNLDGDKISITELFDKEIEIINVRFMPSKIAEGKICSQIQLVLEGKKFISFTTSVVLYKQFQKYKHELPFLATIRKRGKYHILT